MMLWDHGHPYIQSTPVLCVYRHIDYLASFYSYILCSCVHYQLITCFSVHSIQMCGANVHVYK